MENVNTVIFETLREIGVPTSMLGYSYLREAILIVYQNPSAMRSFCKDVYCAIAEKFDSTKTRVERAMRHTIERLWDTGDVEILYKYFGNICSPDRGKPTNKEFVSTVVEWLKVYHDKAGD